MGKATAWLVVSVISPSTEWMTAMLPENMPADAHQLTDSHKPVNYVSTHLYTGQVLRLLNCGRGQVQWWIHRFPIFRPELLGDGQFCLQHG